MQKTTAVGREAITDVAAVGDIAKTGVGMR